MGLGQHAVEQRRRAPPAPGSGDAIDPVEGPEQVDGRRPARAELDGRRAEGAAEPSPPPPWARTGWPPSTAAVSRGDADRRRTADPERPDRLPDGGHVAAVDPDELGRQPRLVDQPDVPVAASPDPADRLQRRASRPVRSQSRRPRRRPRPTPRGRSRHRTRSRCPRSPSSRASGRPA